MTKTQAQHLKYYLHLQHQHEKMKQLFLNLLVTLVIQASCRLLSIKGDQNEMISKVEELVFNGDKYKQVYGEKIGYTAHLPPIKWSNMVFVILSHNLHKLDKLLLEEHFRTWMREIGDGLDILFVFDENDERPDDDLLPDASEIKPTVHIYRSSAMTTDKKVLNKVIDAMTYADEKFGINGDKYFYIKMDPDSFLVPDNFLFFMNELYHTTYPKPVDFGRRACFKPSFCHSQGGMYGLSRSALRSIKDYIKAHPGALNEFHSHRKTNENLMEHEDFAVSYLFNQATGYPMVSLSTIGENYRFIKKPFDRNLISIHQAKFKKQFKELQNFYYTKDTFKRSIKL